MNLVMERSTVETRESVAEAVDSARIIEYGGAQAYVVSDDLLGHLKAARHGLHVWNRPDGDLDLVRATAKRLVRLSKEVDEQLFFELMVYARFKLHLSAGEVSWLSRRLTTDQQSSIRKMVLAGKPNRGRGSERSLRQ